MVKRLLVFVLLCFISAPIVSADFESEKLNNWHHWRGPIYTGAAVKGNPPIKWDESTNIKWKSAIPGNGSSTPIVWGDKIFVTTAIETNKEKEGAQANSRVPTKYYKFDVICFDKNSGKVIWQKTAAETVPHEGHHATNTYASGSPTTDGKFLYVTFGSEGFFCYDLDGNLIWKRDLGDMETRGGFGEGTSLTVYKDNLIVNWDHEGPSFIANLDAKTGKDKWRTDRDEQTSWATPIVVEHSGAAQVIANGANRTISYDLKDGSVIWKCGGQTTNPIPTPFVYKDNVYASSGFRGAALFAIPLDSKGDITGTDKIAWSLTKNTPYIPSPLLVKDRIYFTKDRNPIMTCVNADTGEIILPPARLPELMGTMYSSPAAVGENIFFTTRDGKTLVVKVGEETKPLSVNKLDDEIDASPVIVGDNLFMRGKDYLYCIAER